MSNDVNTDSFESEVTRPEQRTMTELYEDYRRAKKLAEEHGVAMSEYPTRPIVREKLHPAGSR